MARSIIKENPRCSCAENLIDPSPQKNTENAATSLETLVQGHCGSERIRLSPVGFCRNGNGGGA
jgi:hypothetical protein